MAISILSDHLANQIAAGEVIERPSSVVKELVENSIDAKATEITVTIEDAGRKLIKVVDNGNGMDSSDVVLSLQRHATSKLTSQEDLFAIKTLGFRGEALPSIASVSDFKIVSRPKDEEMGGVELVSSGGVIEDLRDVAAPIGTEISVGRLFFNTPARLKFLKSDQTEQGRIVDTLNAMSICHHNVSFRLIQNGRDLLNRPASVDPLKNIASWLGREVAGRMRPIALDTGAIKISGFVGATEDSRSSRNGELFFVNGRRVLSKSFQFALTKAYEKVLQPGRYPVAVIFLDIAPNLVDVNVHPAKTEVRFHNEKEVISLLIKAIQEQTAPYSIANDLLRARSQNDPLKLVERQATQNAIKPSIFSKRNAEDTTAELDIVFGKEDKKSENDILSEKKKEKPIDIDEVIGKLKSETHKEQISVVESFVDSAPQDDVPQNDEQFPQDDVKEEIVVSAMESVREDQKSSFTYKYLAQLNDKYLLIEHNSGLMIVNQHRAHERIIFDTYVEKAEVAVQQFLMPIVLHLDGEDNAIMLDYEEDFLALGFLIHPLSGYSHIVRGMPALIEGDPETVLRAIIDDLRENSVASIKNAGKTQRHELLSSMACKGAIKAGKVLSVAEAIALLDKWSKSSDLNICPHGDNITLTITQEDLKKRFAM